MTEKPKLMRTAPKNIQIHAWCPDVEDWIVVKWDSIDKCWRSKRGSMHMHLSHWVKFYSSQIEVSHPMTRVHGL